MTHIFSDWIACPECDSRDDVSILAHNADVVIECHSCGEISEYKIGKDLPIQDLDMDAIDAAVDKTSD